MSLLFEKQGFIETNLNTLFSNFILLGIINKYDFKIINCLSYIFGKLFLVL